MSPPDDTPLAARLARCSEWWFTPRWRALLTWVALTAISAQVLFANWDRFAEMTHQPIAYLNRFLPAPLPPVFGSIANNLTCNLLLIWFQPLALRLSLWRGLAWMGLPLVGLGLWWLLDMSPGYGREWIGHAIQCGSAAFQCWVLCGWRSRPWMSLLAQVTASALQISDLLDKLDLPSGLEFTVYQLPYAALLLYGTRLLRPEERAGGTTAN